VWLQLSYALTKTSNTSKSSALISERAFSQAKSKIAVLYLFLCRSMTLIKISTIARQWDFACNKCLSLVISMAFFQQIQKAWIGQLVNTLLYYEHHKIVLFNGEATRKENLVFK